MTDMFIISCLIVHKCRWECPNPMSRLRALTTAIGHRRIRWPGSLLTPSGVLWFLLRFSSGLIPGHSDSGRVCRLLGCTAGRLFRFSLKSCPHRLLLPWDCWTKIFLEFAVVVVVVFLLRSFKISIFSIFFHFFALFHFKISTFLGSFKISLFVPVRERICNLVMYLLYSISRSVCTYHIK